MISMEGLIVFKGLPTVKTGPLRIIYFLLKVNLLGSENLKICLKIPSPLLPNLIMGIPPGRGQHRFLCTMGIYTLYFIKILS